MKTLAAAALIALGLMAFSPMDSIAGIQASDQMDTAVMEAR